MESVNTSYIPSAKDLLLVFPRLAQRAGSFALYHMPETVDNIAGKIWSGGSIIADATGQHTMNSTITNMSNILPQSTAAALGGVVSGVLKEGGAEESSSMVGTMLNGALKLKNFGGIFSYLLSRWALITFIVVRTGAYISGPSAHMLTASYRPLSSTGHNSTPRPARLCGYDGM